MNRHFRATVVCTLIAGTALVGCQPAMSNPHDHGGGMVDEYRPAWKPVERPAPGSAVYVLWRWQPVPAGSATTTGAATELLGPTTSRPQPARRRTERAMEVVEVTLAKGQPIGFRRRPDGLLVAVSGPTTRPLSAGHYCWHLLPGNPMLGDQPNRTGSSGNAVRDGLVIGAVVAAIAGAIAAIVAIDHNDRHAHLGDTIVNTALNPPASGN